MTLYLNSYTYFTGESAGFSWHTSKRAAASAAAKFLGRGSERDPDSNESATTELVTFSPTKAGIIRLLCRYATHPDNG